MERSWPTATGRPLIRAEDFPPFAAISREITTFSSSSSMPNSSSTSRIASASNSSVTRARDAPRRTISEPPRPPRTNVSAPSTMDLPEPVSPVRHVNPAASSNSARTTKPKSSMESRRSIDGSLPVFLVGVTPVKLLFDQAEEARRLDAHESHGAAVALDLDAVTRREIARELAVRLKIGVHKRRVDADSHTFRGADHQRP